MRDSKGRMTGSSERAPTTLELDVGNSCMKWRLLDGAGRRVDGGRTPHPAAAGVNRPWRALVDEPPGRVRIGSVAGAEQDRNLVQALEADGAGRIDFAVSEARCGRLRSGYREPARLGVDRWLALVAAADRCDGAYAVADAGSALTLDLVDEDGAHEGGWIVPGLRMMRAALLAGTAGIRVPDTDPEVASLPGRNTAEAVGHGTVLMAQDFVHRRLDAFRRRFPLAVLFVTGGDGPKVAGTGEGTEVIPELVLDGLVRVLG